MDSFITQDMERASEVGKLGSDILSYYLVGLTSTDKLNTHAVLNVCGCSIGLNMWKGRVTINQILNRFRYVRMIPQL